LVLVIFLWNRGLGVAGAVAFAEALKKYTHLKKVLSVAPPSLSLSLSLTMDDGLRPSLSTSTSSTALSL
jgi:hypothetical protein